MIPVFLLHTTGSEKKKKAISLFHRSVNVSFFFIIIFIYCYFCFVGGGDGIFLLHWQV